MNLWYSIVDLLPFEWAQPGSMFFMKNALLAVLVISPLFGLLSTMVVESRMSFFSDALGHSAFTGIAIGTLLSSTVTLFSGADPMWFAVLFAVVFALLFTFVRKRTSLASDTVIGVFSSTAVALVFLSLLWAAAASPSSMLCSSATSSAWSPVKSVCWPESWPWSSSYGSVPSISSCSPRSILPWRTAAASRFSGRKPCFPPPSLWS